MAGCTTRDDLRTIEVILDGEKLFAAEHTTRIDRLFCAFLCWGVRIAGVALIGLAALLLMREDGVGAMNVGLFGMVMLVAGIMGMRQYQNTPRRLILDENGLNFSDLWTGTRRRFPRTALLDARCGQGADTCAIYVTHPDGKIDLLFDDISADTAQQIASAINEHLVTMPPEREPAYA